MSDLNEMYHFSLHAQHLNTWFTPSFCSLLDSTKFCPCISSPLHPSFCLLFNVLCYVLHLCYFRMKQNNFWFIFCLRLVWIRPTLPLASSPGCCLIFVGKVMVLKESVIFYSVQSKMIDDLCLTEIPLSVKCHFINSWLRILLPCCVKVYCCM